MTTCIYPLASSWKDIYWRWNRVFTNCLTCLTGNATKSGDSQARRPPGQLSALSSRRTTNITISLFVISALFIVFTLPYKVLHLRFLLDRNSEPNMFTFEVCLLLFECNFVVNYFVYLYFNSFFRAQLNNFWKVKCTSYQWNKLQLLYTYLTSTIFTH